MEQSENNMEQQTQALKPMNKNNVATIVNGVDRCGLGFLEEI